MDTWVIVIAILGAVLLGLGEMWLGLIGSIFKKWAGHEAIQKLIKSEPPGIIGKIGTVREVKGTVAPNRSLACIVFVYGELWQAKPLGLDVRLNPRQKVRVLKQDGMVLIVEPLSLQ